MFLQHKLESAQTMLPLVGAGLRVNWDGDVILDDSVVRKRPATTIYSRPLHEWEADPGHVYSQWHLLPNLILEKIFQYVPLRYRPGASQVCRNWHDAFFFPRVWYTFTLDDNLFTKAKFNLCVGWEKYLDNTRVTIFLQKTGKHIRTMIFKEMNNLFSLYCFMKTAIMLYHYEKGTLEKVNSVRLLFAVKKIGVLDEERTFGTGGQMLEKFQEFLGIMNNLKTLDLRNFLLDIEDVPFLDQVCGGCCETLQTLHLINITRKPKTLLHPGIFVNLQTLHISPQNIGADLLELLGETKLTNLYIVQNKFTEGGRSIASKVWASCRKANPRLRVHLVTEGSQEEGNNKAQNERVWQPGAPVKSIIYDSPYPKINTSEMMQIVLMYGRDLEVFAHKQIPRFHMPKHFHDRVDSSLLLLVRQCPYIHTLMIREKVSTATILLIAYTAKNLQYFYVRRNAIVLKADWPYNPEWSPEFYSWLCKSSCSYESMECEVSQILGQRWQALTDKQFRLVNFTVDKQYYMFSS